MDNKVTEGNIQQQVDNLNKLEEFYYTKWYEEILPTLLSCELSVTLDGKIFELIEEETKRIKELYDKRNLVGR